MLNLKTELMKTMKQLVSRFVSEKVWSESELQISDKVVGGKVEIIAGDGTLSDAPDGDYQLGTDFKFTVKDSLIVSIEGEAKVEDAPADEVVVEAADAPVEDAPVEDAPAEDNVSKIVEALAPMFDEMMTLINGLRTDVDSLMNTPAAATKEDVDAFTKEVSTLNETIQTLAKVPVQFSKTSNDNTVKESKEDKLTQMARILGGK